MKPHCFRNGGSARFEFLRKMGWGEAIGEDFLNHRAAPKEWRHGIEEFFLAIEHADSCWSVDFVARECEKIAIEGLHIDWRMVGELRRIKKNKGTMLVCKLCEFYRRSFDSKDITHTGECEEFYL